MLLGIVECCHKADRKLAVWKEIDRVAEERALWKPREKRWKRWKVNKGEGNENWQNDKLGCYSKRRQACSGMQLDMGWKEQVRPFPFCATHSPLVYDNFHTTKIHGDVESHVSCGTIISCSRRSRRNRQMEVVQIRRISEPVTKNRPHCHFLFSIIDPYLAAALSLLRLL